MKKILYPTIILMIIPLFLIVNILINGLRQPVPFEYGSQKSQILTRTNILQLTKPDGWFGLMFNESSHSNPYIFGFEGNDLYFKDALGRVFAFRSNTQVVEQVNVEKYDFLRQDELKGECNPDTMPDYHDSFYEQIPDWCYSITQANVKIDAWPYLREETGSVAFGARHLVITKDNQTSIIHESRDITDIVISEDGEYLAITAARPKNSPGSFEPTDIHLLKL